jgi:hypothetical protein
MAGNKKWYVLGGITIVVVALIAFGMNMSYNNAWAKKSNLLVAQKKVVEANFDKMWKVLQSQAGVLNEYKDAFGEVYGKIMEGRYGNDNGGMLMKWIKESNPEFDGSLYKKLMVSIEALREDFFQQQKYLVSIQKQMYDLTMVQPASWFVGDEEVPEIIIISSSKTKAVIDSGMEENIELFNKKPG